MKRKNESSDEPSNKISIYKAEGYFHVIEAYIKHDWLYVGESEESGGYDHDREYREIPWVDLAAVLHVGSKEELLQRIKQEGKHTMDWLERILDQNGISYVYDFH